MANNKRRPKSGLGEIKVLIATLSITITLSLWNLFSNQAHNEFLTASSSPAGNASDEQQFSSGSPPLPPMPSLVSANQQELSGNLNQLYVVLPSSLMGAHSPTGTGKMALISPPSAPQSIVEISDDNADDEEHDQEQGEQDAGSGIVFMGGPEPEQSQPQDQQPSQPQDPVTTTTGSS